MWNFKRDLELGLKEELKVMNALINNWWKLEKNSDKKWVDLIWDYNVEVKYDIMSKRTGNYYIETSCWWKPSWVYKYKDLDYWCQSDWWDAFIISKDNLIQLIKDKGKRKK